MISKEVMLFHKFKFDIIYKTFAKRQKSYSHTVILPKTDFPLRLENKKLIERDSNINEV